MGDPLDDIVISDPKSAWKKILQDRTTPKKSGSIESPFTILVDSNEAQKGHLAYKFDKIVSDSDENYAPISVRTEVANLYVGDYSIKEIPHICIERKTLPDLFHSLTRTRGEMEERVMLMSDKYDYSVVVIEANATDIYENPPARSRADPKTIYRTVLAWSARNPGVHWMFCGNRDFAEQTTYRLLRQFWDSRSRPPMRPRKIIEDSVEAYRLGLLARLCVNEYANDYKSNDPLSGYFVKGWDFASRKFMAGDHGRLKSHDKKDPTSGVLTAEHFASKFNGSELPFPARRNQPSGESKPSPKGKPRSR